MATESIIAVRSVIAVRSALNGRPAALPAADRYGARLMDRRHGSSKISLRQMRWVAAVGIAVLATSCAVEVGTVNTDVADGIVSAIDAVDDVAADRGSTNAPAVGDNDELVEIGPIPAGSHWHSAYVVRICDDVLPPFASEADPAGIHSHGDGLIHIHPLFVESGFENATLGLFADAIGFTLADGELTVPGGGTWKNGDDCGGEPGQVFVDRWDNHLAQGQPERIFSGLEEIRFERDGELYQIAFGPPASLPVVPPTMELLPEVSQLGVPQEQAWLYVANDADPVTARVWIVDDVTALPCGDSAVADRVLIGVSACYSPKADRFEASEFISAATAVRSNGIPGVEIIVTPAFRSFLEDAFADEALSTAEPVVTIAFEVEGSVVIAPAFLKMPLSETRVMITGGMTESSARDFARVLNG